MQMVRAIDSEEVAEFDDTMHVHGIQVLPVYLKTNGTLKRRKSKIQPY